MIVVIVVGQIRNALNMQRQIVEIQYDRRFSRIMNSQLPCYHKICYSLLKVFFSVMAVFTETVSLSICVFNREYVIILLCVLLLLVSSKLWVL